MVDADELLIRLGELSRSAVHDFAVDAMLAKLCEVAVAAIGADGAGVVASEESGSRFVHAVGVSGARTAERLQELLAEGPCTGSIASREPVRVEQVAGEDRWPLWADAVSRAGIGSVLAVPLVIRDRCWGALDLYRRTPGPWSAEELAAAVLLAEVAASYVVMAIDRDVAAAARAELETRATTDPLTGLPNRALLLDRVEHAVAVAARTRRAVGVLFLDLDRFKQVNDTLGHGAGDELLVEVTRRMRATLRVGDTLARLAGDEFVLVCEDLSLDHAEATAELTRVAARLHRALAAPVPVGGTAVTASVSIGASVAAGAADVADLLAQADTAMYAAKGDPGRPVVVHDSTTALLARAGRELRRDLSLALGRGQLSVDHQPVVDPVTGRIEAVQAVLCWDHPERGRLGPAEFVPLAGATGLRSELGRWYVTEAARQLRTWDDTVGPAAPRTAFCGFAASELLEPALADTIRSARERFGLGAERIGLVVAQADTVDPLVPPALASYRRLGHPVAVDGLGSSLSALSALSGLTDLPVDHARLDPSLVAGLPGDDRSRAGLEAVRVVTDNLGLTLVAAGVETAAQAGHLVAAGCRHLQGSWFHPPMSGDELTALLSGGGPTPAR